MTKRIHKNGEIVIKDGEKYLPVLISQKALNKINKLVLGDGVDKDNFKERAERMDVHEDCIELYKEFQK